ncbi:MAG: hypothetical protein A3E92_03150 [Candidatus Taylorbacteria bacterium RIFCSPHIGHO2_12_FULL_42_34]|nr:MAG: hypothetical protein A3E92_03150 [Candidatus Taylorbacteria bacterium RIFCSPHIGHO2_12_FULL_42_34]
MSRPQSKVKIEWSPEFAYAIGLLTTDGSLSIDGRHINFTSKDVELVELFKKCLNLQNRIGLKSGVTKIKNISQVQFGDVNFYKFLQSIGLMPRKTKLLAALEVPDWYFFDFLRGHFDGDGTFYSYWDPRWKSSFMYYTVFISASLGHIRWLQKKIFQLLQIKGHLNHSGAVHQLKYAKKESLKMLDKLYNGKVVCLTRKYLKIRDALFIMGRLPKTMREKHARVL